MSRIGRHPIEIPAGVTVTVSDDNVVVVKGPKGQLEQAVNKNIHVAIEDGHVKVTRPNDEKQNRAMHGLYRALIANMVNGVTHGFKRTLQMVGTGYRAEAKGSTLPLQRPIPRRLMFPESTSSRWEISQLIFAPSVRRSRISVRASSMMMRSFAARKARPVRSKKGSER